MRHDRDLDVKVRLMKVKIVIEWQPLSHMCECSGCETRLSQTVRVMMKIVVEKMARDHGRCAPSCGVSATT